MKLVEVGKHFKKLVKFANNFTKFVEFANIFIKFVEYNNNFAKFVGLTNNFYKVCRSCEQLKVSRSEKKLCKVPKIYELPYEVHRTYKQLL